MILFSLILTIFAMHVFAQKTCIQKVYRGPDNPMNCICNATYCDEFPPLGQLMSNQAAIYTSSQSGKRFARTTQSFSSSSTTTSIKIYVNESQKFQKIIGFGGAFTDAAGINLQKLNPAAQKNLIQSYFGSEGIGYTIGRTPMAGCDFSAHPYSYDDIDGDLELKNFSLTIEDYSYKIPFIKMAQDLIGEKLKLFASVWSAPGWMKDTGEMQSGGHLKGDIDGPYYRTWANYFVRYFEEYAKNNISYWGVTMQNEPVQAPDWQSMNYNSTMERDFAKVLWGPTLRANDVTKNLNLMILDDQRLFVDDFSKVIFGDQETYNLIDGLAIHWYLDVFTKPNILTQFHQQFPDKFILYTEACNIGGVKMGEWSQGDNYAHDIIQDLQNWANGWTDWNLCLDPEGGPNWASNFVDSPIIVSNTSDEFEKQPMYYALGHFAKFIVPDSYIIELDMDGVTNSVNLEGIAALTPSGQIVIVLNNRDVSSSYEISIINNQGRQLNLNLEARSWTTIVYQD